MTDERRRAGDKSFEREFGELTALVRQMSEQMQTYVKDGADFREYQRDRNHDILNSINALTLSSQLMGQKLDESCAQLNEHHERMERHEDRFRSHEARLREHDQDRAKVKGALKAIGVLGVPGAGGLGAYLSKLFGS